MKEIKIRYTWRRKVDSEILQRVFSLDDIERGDLLHLNCFMNPLYDLIARDLWTEYVDAEGNEIYNGDIMLVPNKKGDYSAEVFRSVFGGWEICPNNSKINDNASMVVAKQSKIISNIHLKQQ